MHYQFSQPRIESVPKQQNFEREEAAQMMKAGVAKPAVGEWAKPTVSVSKKNCSLAFFF